MDESGAFAGGIIAPGVALGARSLTSAAARLPMIELRAPERVIGRSTRAAMQSGVVLGEAAQMCIRDSSQAARSIEDLEVGMELKGTVRNVVDFGAFVDIGVHQDGLVHISKLASRFVKHPSEVVAVGDTVTVWVTGVDRARKKISLTMVEGRMDR